jgi:hypothetical protein
MIEFKKDWAEGMDGGAGFIVSRVKTVELAGSGAGQAVDYSLAAVCELSSSPSEIVNHLNYIIIQLAGARNNIKREA